MMISLRTNAQAFILFKIYCACSFQTGYLDVRIPPNILDEDDIEGPGSAAMEGGTIRLRCRSTGKPEPKVHWKRKDNRHIVIRSDGAREKQGLYAVVKYKNQKKKMRTQGDTIITRIA